MAMSLYKRRDNECRNEAPDKEDDERSHDNPLKRPIQALFDFPVVPDKCHMKGVYAILPSEQNYLGSVGDDGYRWGRGGNANQNDRTLG